MVFMTTDGARRDVSTDPRALNSRRQILSAAVDVVSEAGSADVSVSTIARVAGVSRQAVYLHYPDRDAILTAAATDLIMRSAPPADGRELDPTSPDTPHSVRQLTQHLAQYRSFYRALARVATSSITQLVMTYFDVEDASDVQPDLPPETLRDLARFYSGGIAALLADWMRDTAEEPHEAVADRIWAVFQVLGPPDAIPVKDPTTSDTRRKP